MGGPDNTVSSVQILQFDECVLVTKYAGRAAIEPLFVELSSFANLESNFV
jgi:hypothetical protein